MSMNRAYSIFLAMSLCLLPIYSHAQTERRDTITAAVVTTSKGPTRDAGTVQMIPADFRHMASALGGGDAIKYIQTLPGISTGAEGSSSFYARGGNLGNNVVTLDGIPLYGSSHLLGFTSVYSQDIVSDIHFQVGGFDSDEGNMTSAHMNVSTLNGSMDKASYGVSVSNAMIGGTISSPVIRDRVSFIASLNVSPIGPEISAVKSLSPAMDSIRAIKAAVYDAYGKLFWKMDDNQSMSLSIFNSLDSYGYRYGDTSDERMKWTNTVAQLSYDSGFLDKANLHSAVSFNRFSNYQGALKTLNGVNNEMAMVSTISETSVLATLSGKINRLRWQGGAKLRYATFKPGTSCGFADGVMSPITDIASADRIHGLLCMMHGQIEFKSEGHYVLRAGGRLNTFSSKRVSGPMDNRTYFEPEADLLARVNVTNHFGFEATADWTAQFYHTLEGIPLGWSLDMMIPSDARIAPERASQYYLGTFLSTEHHRMTIGAYTKKMDNLIWFADASQLFNSVLEGWRDGISIGTGTSQGIEFLYEMDSDRLNCRLAYTLSKTDRLFPDLNDGLPFPAKFDRRHIMNFTSEYVISRNGSHEFGLSTLFTYQSGHWATIPAGQYSGSLPGNLGDVQIDHFTSINNWELPPYIRWDLSLFFNHGLKSRHPGTLTVGLYNVLNRHNVYSITFDTTERKWKQMSIFPIMPSLSWSIKF